MGDQQYETMGLLNEIAYHPIYSEEMHMMQTPLGLIDPFSNV